MHRKCATEQRLIILTPGRKRLLDDDWERLSALIENINLCFNFNLIRYFETEKGAEEMARALN